MFCNNCGNKLPDGARFCSVCGAKVETVAADNKTSYVDNMSFERETEPKRTFEPQSSVSFDWSGVIDESHKREIPSIKSPWGNTGLDDDIEPIRTETSAPKQVRYSDSDIFEDINKPSAEPSRTMNFIDVLKAEREEKAQAAARAAAPVTERVETRPDYTAFDNADGFAFENDILPKREREVTQGYTDLNLDIVKEMNERPAPSTRPVVEDNIDDITSAYLDDAPSFDQAFSYDYDDEDEYAEPVHSKRYATPIEPVEESYFEDYIPTRAAAAAYTAEQTPVAPTVESAYTAPAVESAYIAPAAEPAHVAPAVESAYAAPAVESAYIAPAAEPAHVAPAAEPAYAAPTAPVVEQAPVAPVAEPISAIEDLNIEDMYTDEPLTNTTDLEAELAAILGGATVAAAATATPVEAAPVIEEAAPVPEVAPVVEAAPVAEAAPVVEAVAPAASTESEIDALKRRLAELMGEPTDTPEPVVKHEVPDLEELFADEPVIAPEAAAATVAAEAISEPVAVAPSAIEAAPAPAVAAPEDGADIFALFEEDLAAPVQPVDEVPAADATAVVEAAAAVADIAVSDTETDAMSIDDLEKDLFGEDFAMDAEAEATKKIDKFYTLYKKNEEFQRLLDEEYNKLQGEDVQDTQMSELEALMADQQLAQMSGPSVQEAQQQAQADLQAQQQAQELQQLQQLQQMQQMQQAQPVQSAAPQPIQQPVQQYDNSAVVQQAAPIPVEDRQLSKKELRAQKKAAKKNKPVVEEDDEDEGGNVLTIIAVIIAVLLVLLLGVILILNFAPDSGLGLKLDSLIQNITSYFSVLDGMNDEFLL